AGVGFILVACREFIELWLGPGAFVGCAVLGVFCAVLSLGANHVGLSLCARSAEDERYAVTALASAAPHLHLPLLLRGPLGLRGGAAPPTRAIGTTACGPCSSDSPGTRSTDAPADSPTANPLGGPAPMPPSNDYDGCAAGLTAAPVPALRYAGLRHAVPTEA